MKYWHINTCTENNKNHMIKNNICYIGLGLRGDIPDKCSNRNIYNIARTSSHHTPSQFRYFNNHKENGDYIILYENKIGHIYYGKITGEITTPKFGYELAPDWHKDEIQYHIKVYEWIKIVNPHMKNVRRKSLVEITHDDYKSIIGNTI